MDPDILTDISILSGDILPVRRITDSIGTDGNISKKGTYFQEEEDLPKQLAPLLHGRAYVINDYTITSTSPSSPDTFYIAADKVQGLVIPARGLSIDSQFDDAYYRWTDDGIKWTNWITLPNGTVDSYPVMDMNRFAEVQVYGRTTNTVIGLRASR